VFQSVVERKAGCGLKLCHSSHVFNSIAKKIEEASSSAQESEYQQIDDVNHSRYP
jgi:hypothetical protein